eukprot:scaffold34692_cov15-Tisochrysis_lutea.AAC.2
MHHFDWRPFSSCNVAVTYKQIDQCTIIVGLTLQAHSQANSTSRLAGLQTNGMRQASTMHECQHGMRWARPLLRCLLRSMKGTIDSGGCTPHAQGFRQRHQQQTGTGCDRESEHCEAAASFEQAPAAMTASGLLPHGSPHACMLQEWGTKQ